ncbi:MAG: hypothetical protein JSW45_09255 [Thiotrichales bacterium]|nr:MAG: hypothetical protein JSW45_09255 [Thiotrichales bacterium]
MADQETHTAIFIIRSGPHGGAWIEGCRPGDHITITPIKRLGEHEIECSFTAPEHVEIIDQGVRLLADQGVRLLEFTKSYFSSVLTP